MIQLYRVTLSGVHKHTRRTVQIVFGAYAENHDEAQIKIETEYDVSGIEERRWDIVPENHPGVWVDSYSASCFPVRRR